MKDPFAAGNNAGVTALLVGLILLVFAAIGMSLLVENNIGLPDFSSSSEDWVARNDSLRGKVNHLERKIAAYRRQQAEAGENRKKAELAKDLRRQAASAREESSIIRSLIKSEQASLELLAKGKEECRLRYRDQIRLNAIGRTFPEITTPLGKVYRDVRIKNITSLGVSIFHRNGASCLGYHEMPAGWRKKYMFTAKEMATAAARERKRQAAVVARSSRRKRAGDNARQSASRQQVVASLRRQIAATSTKYHNARLEASLARNKASYNRSLRLSRSYARSFYRYYDHRTGRYSLRRYRPRYRVTVGANRSVPGSLETWEQRAMRYERAAAKYAARLGSLRAQLATCRGS